jgi:hypothetical protein
MARAAGEADFRQCGGCGEDMTYSPVAMLADGRQWHPECLGWELAGRVRPVRDPAEAARRTPASPGGRRGERRGGNTMTGYIGPIESQTLKNTYFRQALFTGKHAQLVVIPAAGRRDRQGSTPER